MGAKVLLVEDDPGVVDIARTYLAHDGHDVLVATDGVEGLRFARESNPDLLVLDLMLPKMDGTELCRILREESDVPIVMLTARYTEEDRLAGLDLGADDYITKPYSPRELCARVRAVLRRTARTATEVENELLQYNDVRVDQQRRVATIGGQELTLTPTEFRLLVMFINDPGRTFTRDHIIEKVFGYDFDGLDRTVDAHVSHLRRKLENGGERKYIHTIYEIGYRFGDAKT
jgi:DNA-binding response OmpR family regulator